MTDAHEHLVELRVAFGAPNRWGDLIDSKLISNEPTCPLINRSHLGDRKYKLEQKKGKGKLDNPAFDTRLIFGTYKSNP